jgi:hypothetical protein
MLIFNPPPRAAKSAIAPPAPSGRIAIKSVVPGYRKVPLSYWGHARGYHPVREGHGMVSWEGLTERDAIACLSDFDELIRIESQPATIFYQCDEEDHRYTPDFAVYLSDVPFELECLGFATVTYLECKPAWRVPLESANLDRSFRAARLAFQHPTLLITDLDLLSLNRERSHVA